MSFVSVFLGPSVSGDTVDFSSNVSVFIPFTGVANLPLSFSVYLEPDRTDVVTECKRLSLTSSGDFLPPFTVTVFDEFADGRNTASRDISDWSRVGACDTSVLEGFSVPLTSFAVSGEHILDTVCVADVSC